MTFVYGPGSSDDTQAVGEAVPPPPALRAQGSSTPGGGAYLASCLIVVQVHSRPGVLTRLQGIHKLLGDGLPKAHIVTAATPEPPLTTCTQGNIRKGTSPPTQPRLSPIPSTLVAKIVETHTFFDIML